jgi:hypothetical protein
MANYLKENPYFIDTAPVSLIPPTYSKVFIKEIRWETFAPSSTLVITTGTGGTLINETTGVGDTDLGVMRFGPFGWVNGIVVSTLSAGNLTITITKS